MWKNFAGHCIYQAPTGASVYQNYFYRWLHIGKNKAIHTMINRRHPQKPMLTYIHQLGFAVRENPGPCCLLGLGGAGIVHALSPFLKQAPVEAIEHSSDIIKIANAYFMLDRLENLSIIEQDASDFVQDATKQYQHILVDLYGEKAYPPQCCSYDFFLNCKRLLLPNGVLALNIVNLNEQWQLIEYIRTIFAGHTVTLPVKRSANVIILASNAQNHSSLLEMFQNNSRIKNLSWDTSWGCVAQL